MDACEMCDSTDFQLLGVLGNTAHLRCRCCGWNQTAPVEELEE